MILLAEEDCSTILEVRACSTIQVASKLSNLHLFTPLTCHLNVATCLWISCSIFISHSRHLLPHSYDANKCSRTSWVNPFFSSSIKRVVAQKRFLKQVISQMQFRNGRRRCVVQHGFYQHQFSLNCLPSRPSLPPSLPPTHSSIRIPQEQRKVFCSEIQLNFMNLYWTFITKNAISESCLWVMKMHCRWSCQIHHNEEAISCAI